MILLAFSDPLHGMVRSNSLLLSAPPFLALTYDITPTFWAWAIHSYSIGIATLLLLVIKYSRTHPLYRTQVGLIIFGNAIPFIGTILTISGLIPFPLRDIAPLTFTLGNVIVAFGLFQYRLFDVKPIALDIVIEHMKDSVFILDTKRRIVDLNHAARLSINRFDDALIGQTVDEAFKPWPAVIARYDDLVGQERSEIVVSMQGQTFFIELSVQPLESRQGMQLGHVLIA